VERRGEGREASNFGGVERFPLIRYSYGYQSGTGDDVTSRPVKLAGLSSRRKGEAEAGGGVEWEPALGRVTSNLPGKSEKGTENI